MFDCRHTPEDIFILNEEGTEYVHCEDLTVNDQKYIFFTNYGWLEYAEDYTYIDLDCINAIGPVELEKLRDTARKVSFYIYLKLSPPLLISYFDNMSFYGDDRDKRSNERCKVIGSFLEKQRMKLLNAWKNKQSVPVEE
jgi:hypothetical protein